MINLENLFYSLPYSLRRAQWAKPIVNFSGDESGSTAPTFNFGSWSVDGSDYVRSTGFSTSALNAAPTDALGLPVLYGGAYQISVGGGATNTEASIATVHSTGGAPSGRQVTVRGRAKYWVCKRGSQCFVDRHF